MSSLADTRGTEVLLDDRTEYCGVARDLTEWACEPQEWNALAGAMLGRYHLEAQIGEGAMGTVYRAHDSRLDRRVAIKMLHTEDPARLLAEARAASAVEHSSIVAIHDFDTVGGTAYIAMEWIEGETLRTILERGPLAAARAGELALELARGLAAAHARGVVHHDLKPANLVITHAGHLKILDFGVAKRAGALPVDVARPGAVHGTAGYMAPEQARGEPTDARTDLFTAGAIIFEMFTGRRAFDGATFGERVAAVLGSTPDLGELGLFAPIVERCLAKQPDERFHSAADLAWALSAVSATARPKQTPSDGLLGSALAMLANRVSRRLRGGTAGKHAGTRRPRGS